MAKKKHHHKKRRHHRIGAMALSPTSPLVKLATVAVGYFLGDSINGPIDSVLPASITTATGVTKYLPAAAQLGLGGLLLMSRKKPSLIKTGIGGVLAGAGLKRALKQLGVVTGYQATPVIGARRMAGYQGVPVVGAMPAQLNGVPAQLQGYRVNGYTPHGSGMGVMGRIGDAADSGSGSGITNTDSSGYMN